MEVNHLPPGRILNPNGLQKTPNLVYYLPVFTEVGMAQVCYNNISDANKIKFKYLAYKHLY